MNKLAYKYLEQYKSFNGPKILFENHYDLTKNNKRKTLSSNKNHLIFGKGKRNAKFHILLESFSDNCLNEICYELLEKILNSINLSIEEVFILDFLNIQSLEKNNVESNEIKIDEILSINKPELIIVMGDSVSNLLFHNKNKIDKMKNKIHNYDGIDLIVTYHPNDLLQNSKLKRPTWEDFKFIRDKYLNG
tara:strand:- start:79 stop:651 length:573 start_codon:yes stop_codon:yes gene_type:complete